VENTLGRDVHRIAVMPREISHAGDGKPVCLQDLAHSSVARGIDHGVDVAMRSGCDFSEI
jgi:hypothetical protein